MSAMFSLGKTKGSAVAVDGLMAMLALLAGWTLSTKIGHCCDRVGYNAEGKTSRVEIPRYHV